MDPGHLEYHVEILDSFYFSFFAAIHPVEGQYSGPGGGGYSASH
jgi:hypothetical protein